MTDKQPMNRMTFTVTDRTKSELQHLQWRPGWNASQAVRVGVSSVAKSWGYDPQEGDDPIPERIVAAQSTLLGKHRLAIVVKDGRFDDLAFEFEMEGPDHCFAEIEGKATSVSLHFREDQVYGMPQFNSVLVPVFVVDVVNKIMRVRVIDPVLEETSEKKSKLAPRSRQETLDWITNSKDMMLDVTFLTLPVLMKPKNSDKVGSMFGRPDGNNFHLVTFNLMPCRRALESAGHMAASPALSYLASTGVQESETRT